MMQTIFVRDYCTNMWSDEAEDFHASYLYLCLECHPLFVSVGLWQAGKLSRIRFFCKRYVINLSPSLPSFTMSKIGHSCVILISSFQYPVEYLAFCAEGVFKVMAKTL